MTTELRLLTKEPDKAYVNDMLWLPKSKVRAIAVQDALQFWKTKKKGQPEFVKLWDETENHIVVPREFITPDQYLNYRFPFIDLTPRVFPKTNIIDNITLRENQGSSWEALREATGGILNLSCGLGKTVLALKKIALLGSPALIVVNDGVQFDHWHKEIPIHLELPHGQEIGSYQGTRDNWQCPITVATIQTLSARARDGDLPEGFSAWFGSAWFDEIHHLAAPTFVLSAPIVLGQRYGLTATAERLDELQWIYHYHVGDVFYSDLSQDLVPMVYFQLTDIEIDLEKNPDAIDKAGEVSIPKLRTLLGNLPESLAIRERCIQEAVDAGRKILCIGHSKDMLRALHERFPGSALCTQETPQNERVDRVKASRIAFAIDRLGKECLNDSALDALFLLTPFSSPNDLQQMLGRIQRAHPGKRNPIAIVFDEARVKPLHGMLYKLKATLKKWKIPFRTLAVPT